jgi:hypothetical protein
VNRLRSPAHRAFWRSLGDLKNVLRAIYAGPPAQAEKTFLKQSEDVAGLGSAEETSRGYRPEVRRIAHSARRMFSELFARLKYENSGITRPADQTFAEGERMHYK